MQSEKQPIRLSAWPAARKNFIGSLVKISNRTDR